MAFDRFLIAPLQSGLQNNVKPWLLPDDAYSKLFNAYVWRGRLKKRFGGVTTSSSAPTYIQNILQSRFRIVMGTTDAAGSFSGAIPIEITPAIGQTFSISKTVLGVTTDTIFTVYQTSGAMYSTGVATGTFNTAPGVVNIVGGGENPFATVYFYPSLPVMGFANVQSSNVAFETTIGWDTVFSYLFIGDQWVQITLGTNAWTGSDSQFFWWYNYRGENNQDNLLFATNYNAADGIRYYDGATWATMTPQVDSVNTMFTARIVIPYKDVLLALNTVEGTSVGTSSTFVNRARWSQNGTPIVATDPNSWRSDIPGRGGYNDAPTKENIVTALILKDRLIVYFDESTWELVYTGNEILPFRWQQINTELGAESTFSIVPFDKVMLGIGNTGVHACNGANVERIDDLIPDNVFQIMYDNNGINRVFGIRDYFTELVYWTLPSAFFNLSTYPNTVLVYNYKTGSWAYNDDSITAFGYLQKTGTSQQWQEAIIQWKDNGDQWAEVPNDPKFRNIVAGNQQGYTFIVDSEVYRNAPALTITNIAQSGSNVLLTIINHNLFAFAGDGINDFMLIENAAGSLTITDEFGTNRPINSNNFKYTVVNANTVAIAGTLTGTYAGGGTVTRVSCIDILTKEYNFYADQGRNAYISRVDFQIDNAGTGPEPETEVGEISVDVYVSTADSQSLTQQATATGAIIGTGILDTSAYPSITYEQYERRLWHPLYFQADGEFIQFRLYFTNEQLANTFLTQCNFTLHSMIIHATPTSNRLQ